MPSPRRIKVFALVVLIGVLVTLYVTGAARQTRSSQFYTKTQDALAQARAHKESAMQDRESGLGAGDSEVGKRLKEAEEVAKRAADRKGDEFHGEHVKEKVLNGKKAKEGERKVPGVAGHYSKQDLGIMKPLKEKDGDKEQAAETEEDHKVKNELNSILKRSPGMFLRTLEITQKANNPESDHILQILLPILEKGETHPSRSLQNIAASIRGRTRRTRARTTATSTTWPDDWTKDRSEYSHQWKKHWWRR